MSAQPAVETVLPPRLVPTLRAGLDAVANHVGLILFPVALDLFLWFGPHFRLPGFFRELADRTAQLTSGQTGELSDLLQASREFWLTLAERYNLAANLRVYPVGIPSLMAGRAPVDTPAGAPLALDLSGAGALLGWLAFSLVGLLLGVLYFDAVARVAAGAPAGTGTLNAAYQAGRHGPLWAAGQILLLTVGGILALLAAMLPVFIFVSLMALFAPDIAQMAGLMISILVVWLLVPLLFWPHGVFVYRQNALVAMLTSLRVVRYLLPSTAMFFLVAVLLSQGMDTLWSAPPPNSWMALIGVAGHAFVSTSLVAASFVYYRDATAFAEYRRQMLSKPSYR